MLPIRLLAFKDKFMHMCPACQIGATLECFMVDGRKCSDRLNKPEVLTGAKIVSDPSLDKKKYQKADIEVRDAHSTGRKRAAVLLPLTQEDGSPVICEWAGLKNAGGGKHPIVGCTGNKATNRHHGPDKNTLNNRREDPRNIHAICAHCHNRWHAHNDIGYADYVNSVGGPDNLPPHDMETRATAEEMVQNELRYQKAAR